MNYLQLINEILTQMDLPTLKSFDEAHLPIHAKIKDYIKRANENILSYHEWGFANDKNMYAKNEFGTLQKNFDAETDTSIIPEPFGSEMIVYWVCVELNQEPNNPKYAHWLNRYKKAFSELNAAGKKCFGNPVFKIERG